MGDCGRPRMIIWAMREDKEYPCCRILVTGNDLRIEMCMLVGIGDMAKERHRRLLWLSTI